MSAGWKLIWMSAAVFVVAFALAKLVVPDVVPVGYAEEPQSSWAVLTAFVLRAIELTAAWVLAISLVVVMGAWVRARLRLLRGRAVSRR